MTIDLSRMAAVRVDPDARRATVQAGSLLSGLDRETQRHGLAVTSGFVSHTGVAGLTLGGGFGWTARKHGLACDNLRAAEVVLADGSVTVASDGHDPGAAPSPGSASRTPRPATAAPSSSSWPPPAGPTPAKTTPDGALHLEDDRQDERAKQARERGEGQE